MFLAKLEKKIAKFTKSSSQNFIDEFKIQLYSEPLIGIASASDPLWNKLKEPNVVNSNHLSPSEWLPGAKSVISYFLPFTKQIRSSNQSEGSPSKEWLYGRYEGEIFNNSVRNLVVGEVEESGWKAVSPGIDERYKVSNHASNWSERHAAFIAGLGTFGLSQSLITELGTAGRFGSVIVDMELEPKQRPYQQIDEYCTKCGSCIDRCIPGAITANGKDKECCSKYLYKILELNKPRYGCGKCQTAVPCEHKNPNERSVL